jgi:hypothetical protein
MARHHAARLAGEAATGYLADIREADPIYAKEGSVIPACCNG